MSGAGDGMNAESRRARKEVEGTGFSIICSSYHGHFYPQGLPKCPSHRWI